MKGGSGQALRSTTCAVIALPRPSSTSTCSGSWLRGRRSERSRVSPIGRIAWASPGLAASPSPSNTARGTVVPEVIQPASSPRYVTL